MRSKSGDGVLLDGRYLTMSPLNSGSFGLVTLARDVKTDELVAVKCLTKPSTPHNGDETFMEDLTAELLYHSRLGAHPNIVNLLHHFETDTHLYIVLEFCSNGDLYEAIHRQCGPQGTEDVREFMLQLVSAVEHMHKRGVYHRDIKPENIFLTDNGSMKLGDFGLATTEQWSEESSVGSDRYMAPEQYRGGYNPEKADIWSIGICLLNILFARNPFATPTMDDLLFADYVRDQESLYDVFPTLSQSAYNVLSCCLALNPEDRSLKGVREAIERVDVWTYDDDTVDEFCAEDSESAAAFANREPLRTPSVQTPHVAQTGYFPWAQALQSTPQQQRQLSIIKDQEEPSYGLEERSLDSEAYAREMGYYIPAPSSWDSTLGMSLPCSPVKATSVNKSSTIPVKQVAPSTSAMHSSVASKSWSDWVDEDEEEEEREREEARKKRLSWSYDSVGAAEDFGDDVEWIGGWVEDLTI